MAKPYNTKSLQEHVGELTPESGGRGKAGVYRHPESGNEAITTWDPLFGDAQSNAFERLGFERVRDAKPEEIHHVVLDAVNRGDAETDSMKGLAARLTQLEGANDENKRLVEENAKLRAALDDKGKSDAKGKPAAPKAGDEKPLADQDAAELRETAVREGVEVDSLNTVKEFRDAIQAARDSNEESEKA